MLERNQEDYQTLGWIINKSECGLYLVIADETIQKEIVEIYGKGQIGIYDYKQYPGGYSFNHLKNWIDSFPEVQTFFLVNFQLAIQREQDLKRLNFSRDMIMSLEKNLIFCTTSYGDDKLIVDAYDFYSFIKLRITFHDDRIERIQPQPIAEQEVFDKNSSDLIQKEKWSPEESRKKLEETYALIEQAKEEENKLEYRESIRLLLKAKEIREKLLGSEHLEMVTIYYKLANMYEKQGLYKEAEKLCEKALEINKKYWRGSSRYRHQL